MAFDRLPSDGANSEHVRDKHWISKVRDLFQRKHESRGDQGDESAGAEREKNSNQTRNQNLQEAIQDTVDALSGFDGSEQTHRNLAIHLFVLIGTIQDTETISKQNLNELHKLFTLLSQEYTPPVDASPMLKTQLEGRILSLKSLIDAAHTKQLRQFVKRSIVRGLLVIAGATGVFESARLANDPTVKDLITYVHERHPITDETNYWISENTISETFATYFQDTEIDLNTWRMTADDIQNIARIYYAAQIANDSSFDEYFIYTFMPGLYEESVKQKVDFPYLVTALRISGQNMGSTKQYNEEVDLSNKQYLLEIAGRAVDTDPILSLLHADVESTLHTVATAGAGLRSEDSSSQAILSDQATPDEQNDIKIQERLSKKLPMNYYDVVRLLNPTEGGMDIEDLSFANGLSYLQKSYSADQWNSFVQKYPDIVESSAKLLESNAALEKSKQTLRDGVDQLLLVFPNSVDAFFSESMNTSEYPVAWDEIGLGKSPNFSLQTKLTRMWRITTYEQSGNREEIFEKSAAALRSEFKNLWKEFNAEDADFAKNPMLDYRRALIADNIYDNPSFLNYLVSHAESPELKQLFADLQLKTQDIKSAADAFKVDQIHLSGLRNLNGRDTDPDFQIATIVAVHGDLFENAEQKNLFQFSSDGGNALIKKWNTATIAIANREIVNTYLLSNESKYPFIRGVDSPYNSFDLDKNIDSYIKKVYEVLNIDPATPLNTQHLRAFLSDAPDQSLSDLLEKTVNSTRQYNSIWRTTATIPYYDERESARHTPYVLPIGATPSQLQLFDQGAVMIAIHVDEKHSSSMVELSQLGNGIVWNDPNEGFLMLHSDGSVTSAEGIFEIPTEKKTYREKILANPASTLEEWRTLLGFKIDLLSKDNEVKSKIRDHLWPYASILDVPYADSGYSEEQMTEIWNEAVLKQYQQYILQKLGADWGSRSMTGGMPMNSYSEESGIVGYYIHALISKKVLPQDFASQHRSFSFKEFNDEATAKGFDEYVLPDFFGKLQENSHVGSTSPYQFISSLIASAGERHEDGMYAAAETVYAFLRDVQNLRQELRSKASVEVITNDFRKEVKVQFPTWNQLTEWLYTVDVSSDNHLYQIGSNIQLMDLSNVMYLNINSNEFSDGNGSPVGSTRIEDLKSILKLIHSPQTDKNQYLQHVHDVVYDFMRMESGSSGWVGGMEFDFLNLQYDTLEAFHKANIQFEYDNQNGFITMKDSFGNVMHNIESFSNMTLWVKIGDRSYPINFRTGTPDQFSPLPISEREELVSRFTQQFESFEDELAKVEPFKQKQKFRDVLQYLDIHQSEINSGKLAVNISNYFVDDQHLLRSNLLFRWDMASNSLDLVDSGTNMKLMTNLNTFSSVVVSNDEVSIDPINSEAIEKLNAFLHSP